VGGSQWHKEQKGGIGFPNARIREEVHNEKQKQATAGKAALQAK